MVCTRFFMLNGHILAWNGSNYSYYSWQYQMPYLWEPTIVSELPITVLTEEEYQHLTTRGRKYSEYAGLKHVHVTGTFRGSIGDVEIDSRCMLDEQTYRSGTVIQRPNFILPAPMPPPVHMTNGWGGQVNNGAGWPPVQNNWPGYGGLGGLPPPPQPNVIFPPPMPPPAQMINGWGAPVNNGVCWAPVQNTLPPPIPRPLRRKRLGNGGNTRKPANGALTDAIRDEEDEEEDLTPMDTVPEDLLWLLPPLLSGYSFEKKTIIRSIVVARGKKGAHMINDWIKGKGGGLVVLLHGVAGVGKTLTAEAVAELLHRPFLGTTASDVEPALKKHLDFATRWNAVLLKRSTSDLMRNALVATFLRLLEYHSGMLFLTTNRVKAFDEAFSRALSVRGRIWWQFLNFFDRSDAARAGLFNRAAMKPFNGRVIKNIVRTAQALAISSCAHFLFPSLESSLQIYIINLVVQRGTLCMRHLRTVINITEKFGHDTAAVKNVDGAEAGLILSM
ncbi:hypothetical protein BKA62DRAFT_705369, partial [Auriculariales sp. MPI-PUGE-AT-0066]